MAVENFAATWTEVDSPGKVTLSATSATLAARAVYEASCYAYRDFGTGNIAGDFTHQFTMVLNVSGADSAVWRCSNALTTSAALYIYYEYGTLTLMADVGGDSSAQSTGTYYMTVTRASTTITADIYSDSARTTLVDSIAATHANVSDARRYMMIGGHTSYGSGAPVSAFVISDLDLDAGGGEPSAVIVPWHLLLQAVN